MAKLHDLLKNQYKKFIRGRTGTVGVLWRNFVRTVNEDLWQEEKKRSQLEQAAQFNALEIAKRNSHIRTIFETFPDIFLVVSGTGEIVEASGAALGEMGRPPGYWVGKNLAELDEELRVVADHDLGGSVNDLTNKHSVGVLGESRSVDVVSASEGFSPYWWQRFWIKEGINRVNGEIRKGPGGDDYKMIFNENDLTKGEKSIEAALTDVIDAENDVMRDQFAFYALKGPQFTNGKEEETAYLETIAKAFEREMET